MTDPRLERVVVLVEEARGIVDELRTDDQVPFLTRCGMDGVRESLRDANFDLGNVQRHLNEAHRRATLTVKDAK